MNFATWSLRNPKPVALLFGVLCLTGIWGFFGLHVQYVPDLQMPTVDVELSQQGAAPAQLETEVARKVEDSLANLQGVKHIETSIVDGAVKVRAKYEIGKNRSDALIEVKDAVDRVRSELPADLDPPRVSAPFAFNDPVVTYAVSDPHLDDSELSWFVDGTILKTLSGIPGVGHVERLGGNERAVRVDVDPTRMAALGISASDISMAIRRSQQQSSGGRGQVGGGEQAMRVLATVKQARDIADLSVLTPDGRRIALSQIATVTDAETDPHQAALLDGHRVVGIRVYRAFGQGEIALDDGVRRAVSELTSRNKGLRIEQITDSVDYTRAQYRGSMDMLYEGALLAVLVVWWFLKDWRATLVAAAALPLSIIPVFAAMKWLGFSLNTLTLLALAAVVGILVDDAIVEIENIVRHIRIGKSVREATEDAVKEIGLAVTATTLTLAAVFVPTSMMNSIPGLFFREFGWTAALAVLMSLMVARLLTPVMALTGLKVRPSATGENSSVIRRYSILVRWCLNHRGLTMAGAVLVFVASLALIPLLSTGLLPSSDSGTIDVSVELPPGSSLQDTVDTCELARSSLNGMQGISHLLIVAGQGGKDESSDLRHGIMTVVLQDDSKRPTKSAIERDMRRAFQAVPGAHFSIGSGNDDDRLELVLASDSDLALTGSASALAGGIRTIPGLSNVLTSENLDRPEIVVRPDAARAADLGVTAASIGEAARVATRGDFNARLAKLELDDRQIPISVQIPARMRGDLDLLRRLPVPARNGTVPLSSVAAVTLESGPSMISRFDRRRYVTVSAALGDVPLGAAVKDARQLEAARQLPANVTLSDSGNAENVNDLVLGFAIAMLASVAGIYCILVLLFHDFLQPLTILAALPLALGGAFAALLVAHSQLNIPSMIGMVMLMGVVTKNSILLVEYALVGMRERGLDASSAMVEACQKRARPIVMTTVAMISGLLPIALGFGSDATFRQPMATAVIGGLLTSTALSLFVVPVLFTLVAGGYRARTYLGIEMPEDSPSRGSDRMASEGAVR